MSQASWNELKKLRKTLREYRHRIKEKCWDCIGQANRPKIECDIPNCSLYEVRPKHITNYKPKWWEH